MSVEAPESPRTGGSSPPPREPVESMLFKLYVKKWASSQKETDDQMQALEGINAKLSRLNSLLAKLGKLQTQVGDSGDAKKLVDALNKDPGLIYQINQEIKQAALPEHPFRNSEGSASEKWDKYTPKVTDPAFELALRVQVLKDLGARDFPSIQWWCQAHLKQRPTNLREITDQQWRDLANKMIQPAPAGTIQLSEFPIPQDGAIGTPAWLWTEANLDFALRFNEAHASHVPGGLTRSHTGADLYGAVQIVKAEISNLGNRLQSATSTVNQSMQVTTAIMSAITDVTQKMFDAKSKALN